MCHHDRQKTKKKIWFSIFKENLTVFIQVYQLMLKLHVSTSALALLHTVSLWVTMTTGDWLVHTLLTQTVEAQLSALLAVYLQ